jgi:hypothetical protein
VRQFGSYLSLVLKGDKGRAACRLSRAVACPCFFFLLFFYNGKLLFDNSFKLQHNLFLLEWHPCLRIFVLVHPHTQTSTIGRQPHISTVSTHCTTFHRRPRFLISLISVFMYLSQNPFFLSDFLLNCYCWMLLFAWLLLNC